MLKMSDREPTPDSTPPTPAPVLEPSAERPSISTEINIATRKVHTELNRLIVQRLPLALPRKSWLGRRDSPAVLAQGIAAFAQIYLEFESAWREIDVHANRKENDGKYAWLAALRPAGLERTPRLQSDLEELAAITGGIGAGVAHHTPILDRQLLVAPHLLLAYAWVMYMAIFSGGRWIRQQLADAGSDFELAFLSFEGDEDGEDIKKGFKIRLARAEMLLTPQERDEVVEEAQRLFEHCIALVHDLDRQVRWQYLRWAALRALLICCVAAIAWQALMAGKSSWPLLWGR